MPKSSEGDIALPKGKVCCNVFYCSVAMNGSTSRKNCWPRWIFRFRQRLNFILFEEKFMMELSGKNIGFAITGSFCTFDKIEKEIQKLLAAGVNVFPVFSYYVQSLYSRFGNTHEYIDRIAMLTGNQPVLTIDQAEAIGPQGHLDILMIAPCTGNTLAKFVNGITDTPVLMAAKAHICNGRPIVISLSTDDALAMNFKNIGQLLNARHVYFVPFGQDDPIKKPNSMTAHTELIVPTLELALEGKQLQPILCG